MNNPYVGPRPFGSENRLPARSSEVTELLWLLLAERVVLLHGPSGCGKSSLLEAANGLAARLSARGFHRWPTIRLNRSPGNINPFEASALASLGAEPGASWEDALRPMATQPAEPTREAAPDEAGAPREAHELEEPVPELLVFDQFEELLTLHPDAAGDEHRRRFLQSVARVLANPFRYALFVIRDDYLGPLEAWNELVPTRFVHRFRLAPLSVEAAREAILQPVPEGEPVQVPPGSWEEDALASVLTELTRVRGRGPGGAEVEVKSPYVDTVLLQVVCHTVWEKGERPITRQTLEKIGGVDRALGAWYATVVRTTSGKGSPAVTERALREWVRDELLVGGDVRGAVLLDGEHAGGIPAWVARELDTTHRLLRSENRRNAWWYELAHDRLVAPIKQDNYEWFELNLAAFERQTRAWVLGGRNRGDVLRGKDLRDAERWAKGRSLGVDETSLLNHSRDAHQTRLWKLLGAVLVVGLFLVVGRFWALQDEARLENAEAEKKLEITREAQKQADKDARERFAIVVRQLFMEREDTPYAAAYIEEQPTSAPSPAADPDVARLLTLPFAVEKHLATTDPVEDALISRDGERVLLVRGETSVQALVAGTVYQFLSLRDGQVYNAPSWPGRKPVAKDIDHLGGILLVGDEAGATYAWKTGTKDWQKVAARDGYPVYGVLVSPDGRWAAISHWIDCGSQLVDLSKPAVVREFAGLSEQVGTCRRSRLEFSPDSGWLAAGVPTPGGGSRGEVWRRGNGDWSRGADLGSIPSRVLAFGPDSRTLASAYDRTLASWTLDGEVWGDRLKGELDKGASIIVPLPSPNGKHVALKVNDERVVLVRADLGKAIASADAKDPIVRWMDDGRSVRVFSAERDCTLHPDGQASCEPHQPPLATVPTADGTASTVIAVEANGMPRLATRVLAPAQPLWADDRTAKVNKPRRFLAKPGDLVPISAGRSFRLWKPDIEQLQGPPTIESNGNATIVLAEPGACPVFSVNEDVYRWPSTADAPQSLLRLGSSPRALAVTHDCTTVAWAANDDTVGLWRDAEEGQRLELGTLQGHIDSTDAVEVRFDQEAHQVRTTIDGRGVATWLYRPEALRALLAKVNTVCIPLDVRENTLQEDPYEARRNLTRCMLRELVIDDACHPGAVGSDACKTCEAGECESLTDQGYLLQCRGADAYVSCRDPSWTLPPPDASHVPTEPQSCKAAVGVPVLPALLLALRRRRP